jgi:6-phosphogluconolactonase
MIKICKDADDLARTATDIFVEAAKQAMQTRGRFMVALTGGSTPEKTYSRLAEPSTAVNWSRAWIYVGDERCVPLDDPRSNFGMARRLLLSKVPVPVSQQFPVSTEGEPAERAAGYAATLAHSFSVAEDAAPPPFDLILLGLGDDGHTASLFPKAPALQEQKSWVTWSPPGTLPPPVDRVTFTLPLINAGRQILFLVSGQRKTLAVRDVLEGGASPSQRPAAGVHPADGTLTWLLDEPAAQLLSKS